MVRVYLILATVLLAIVVISPPTRAEAPSWTVEEGSRVGFVTSQGGGRVEGRFDRFEAEIAFASDDLESSFVTVTIDIASVNTESKDRDDAIRSAQLFDGATWPTAKFEARRFEATGDKTFDAHGTLTMRDVTREVTLPFTLETTDHPDDPAVLQAHAVGELAVDRLDYGVGQGVWQDTSMVPNQVIIIIDLLASRPKP